MTLNIKVPKNQYKPNRLEVLSNDQARNYGDSKLTPHTPKPRTRSYSMTSTASERYIPPSVEDDIPLQPNLDFLDFPTKQQFTTDVDIGAIVRDLWMNDNMKENHVRDKQRSDKTLLTTKLPNKVRNPINSDKSIYVSKDDHGIWTYSFNVSMNQNRHPRSEYLSSEASRIQSPFSRKFLNSQEQRLQKCRVGSTLVSKLQKPEYEQKEGFCNIPHPEKFIVANNSESPSKSIFNSPSTPKFKHANDDYALSPNIIRYAKTKEPLDEAQSILSRIKRRQTLKFMEQGQLLQHKVTPLSKEQRAYLSSFGFVRPLQQNKVLKNKIKSIPPETETVNVTLTNWSDVINISKMKKAKEWKQLLDKRMNERNELYMQSNQLSSICSRALNDARAWKSNRIMNSNQIKNKKKALWGNPYSKYEKKLANFRIRTKFYAEMVEKFDRDKFRSPRVLWALYLLKFYLLKEWNVTPKLFFHFVEVFQYENFHQDMPSKFFLHEFRNVVDIRDVIWKEYKSKLEEAESLSKRTNIFRWLEEKYHITKESIQAFQVQTNQIKTEFMNTFGVPNSAISVILAT